MRIGLNVGLIAAATLLTAAGSVPAAAATIDNTGSTIVDYYQIAYFGPLGQSFKAVDANLKSIGFNYTVLNPGFSPSAITLQLFEGEGTGGTQIASRTFNLSNPYGITDTDFTGVTLAVGSIYTAALSTSSPYQGVYVTGDDYADGHLFSPNASTGDPSGGVDRDLAFRVIGATTAGVPEPASWALMIVGFGAIGATVRRRNKVQSASTSFT